MTGFMNSPGHRANILDGRYTRIGVGVVLGQGGMYYYAVIFAGKYLIERDKLEMFKANYDPRPGRKPLRRLL